MREDWTKAKIEELIASNGIFCDGDWIESKDQDPNGEVRLIQLADIGDGFFRDRSHRFLTLEKANELSCTFLERDDIILARMPEPLGRATLFPLSGDRKYVTVVDVAIVRPANKYVNKKYLLNNINSPLIRREIEALQSGTTRKRISRKNLSKIDFPLAPLPEQRAIVAKIEELFSELDNGITNLKAAKAKLAIYRQAVLKKAFEGKLTKEWREKNQSAPWKKLRISEIGGIVTGNTPSKKNASYYSSNEYPFYKPTDLEAGSNVKYSIDGLSKEGFETGRMAAENSILVTCIGATIGKTGLIKRKGCFNQQINAIIPDERMDSKYIYYQAISVDFQNQIKTNASATTLPILNKGKFSILEMAICPLKEQKQIVQEIETRLSVCDNILRNIEEGLEKAEALRQSILKKAFEGKLLNETELAACRQQPDWEPAEKLLARIHRHRRDAMHGVSTTTTTMATTTATTTTTTK